MIAAQVSFIMNFSLVFQKNMFIKKYRFDARKVNLI